MANFWDLPRSIRDRIYRLHLIEKDNITPLSYERLSIPDARPHRMPALLLVSKRLEKEAVPIFYGENMFETPSTYIGQLIHLIWPRHVRLISRLTFDWSPSATDVTHDLGPLRHMRALQELNIKVDEREMVIKSVWSRDKKVRRRYPGQNGEQLTPQECLTLLQYPGIAALLRLSNIPAVSFLKRKSHNGNEVGGPLRDGILLTHVLPRITAAPALDSKSTKKKKSKAKKGTKTPKQTHFDFLGLPPELRNRVYDLLLHVSGPVHPSKKPPTSAPKRLRDGEQQPAPTSALSILVACKQIYNEAVGIFYAKTPFVFYFPTQVTAFLLTLGPERLSSIGDITMEYDTNVSGGIAFVDLAFLALKKLPKLRRLRIIMQDQLYEKMRRRHWTGATWNVEKANPGLMSGLATLFELRGVTDILIEDRELGREHNKIADDSEYPDFPGDFHKQSIARLYKALNHFNAALKDAQEGKVNKALLEDNQWQLMDEFPVLEVQEETTTEAEEIEDSSAEDHLPVEDTGSENDVDSAMVAAAPPEAPPGPRRSARIASKTLNDDEFFQDADLEDEQEP
ncbi:hypothetical protein HII31_09858 [Pseudocercospora fuligena]|uniref:DUF7730 domain-containing protein n=1 Tax=Pseudocercospora fuligena TaxID=685502 RepID=A0A8H6VF03_9PEZI|nr:hypothetical protein HII31_09858 [Pseudocercospora fuligena]